MMKTLIASLTIVVVCASSAHAALSHYDGFNYTAGDLTGKNGGIGWGGAYTDTGNSTIVDSTGLAGGLLQTSPGSVRTADGGTATTLNFRSLGGIFGDNETETWISFLSRRNGNTANNLFAGVSFYNSTGAAAADGEVSFAPTTGTTPLTWRILDLGAAQSSASAVPVVADAIDLVVTRIVWNVADPGIGGAGDDAVYMFVNPDLGLGAPANSMASTARNIPMTNIDKMRVAGQNGVDFNFDEIRLGSTFADVTPTLPPNTDFNSSGATNIDDFHILRNNYLTGTSLTQGDANFDGRVNHVDFFLWRSAFVGAGGSLEGLNLTVPEPSTGLMALVATLAGAAGVARRRA